MQKGNEMKNIVIALILMTTPCLVSAHDDFGVLNKRISSLESITRSLVCFTGSGAGYVAVHGPSHWFAKLTAGSLALILVPTCVFDFVIKRAHADTPLEELALEKEYQVLSEMVGEESVLQAISMKSEGASEAQILKMLVDSMLEMDLVLLPEISDLKETAWIEF